MGITDPQGYFLQDLWTGQQVGFKRSSDLFQQWVPAIDAQMWKATSVSRQPARTPKPPMEFTTRSVVTRRSTRRVDFSPRPMFFRRPG